MKKTSVVVGSMTSRDPELLISPLGCSFRFAFGKKGEKGGFDRYRNRFITVILLVVSLDIETWECSACRRTCLEATFVGEVLCYVCYGCEIL
jgi:hypothetical protein